MKFYKHVFAKITLFPVPLKWTITSLNGLSASMKLNGFYMNSKLTLHLTGETFSIDCCIAVNH